MSTSFTSSLTLSFQSTHPLRGATSTVGAKRRASKFQSTHPLRGATADPVALVRVLGISIHAPLAGCDVMCSINHLLSLISIHAPLAGCDSGVKTSRGYPDISIHAPLAGCDRCEGLLRDGNHHFNPRTPCGVRRPPDKVFAEIHHFNPRTPCGVRPRKCTKFSAHFAITDNSIGFPRPECRLLGHFLLIPGACSARERVRTFL